LADFNRDTFVTSPTKNPAIPAPVWGPNGMDGWGVGILFDANLIRR
jgi:hypothetical protein